MATDQSEPLSLKKRSSQTPPPTPEVGTLDNPEEISSDATQMQTAMSEQAPAAPMVPVKPKPLLKLVPSRMREAEAVRNTWCVTPEPGTQLDDILKPGYWAHMCNKLRPWDVIEVRYEDEEGPFFAQLLVRYVGRVEAAVKVVHFVPLGPVGLDPLDSEYKIKYSGAHCKYRVIRKKDGMVLKDELDTYEIAARWLNEHLKALQH